MTVIGEDTTGDLNLMANIRAQARTRFQFTTRRARRDKLPRHAAE
jgi:hypothetical protein